MQELGIATLSSIFVNANSDPKKGEPAKPSDFFYFKPQDDSEKISVIASDTFFSLVAEEKMPSWAVSLAPVEKLRACKGNGSPATTRAWIKRGVLLIAPKVVGGIVQVPLALIDMEVFAEEGFPRKTSGVGGELSLIDIDAGTTYKVHLENTLVQSYWATDIELELLGGFYG